MSKRPSRRTVQRARKRLRENYTLIILHALCQRWGLPTALLKPLLKSTPEGDRRP